MASAMPHLHLQLMQLLGPLILGMKREGVPLSAQVVELLGPLILGMKRDVPRLRVNLTLVYV